MSELPSLLVRISKINHNKLNNAVIYEYALAYEWIAMMYKPENEKDRHKPPWDNHGTYTPCLSLSLLVRLDKDKNRFSSCEIWLEPTVTAHSYELLGWNIQDCCLLYQILIYETWNSFLLFSIIMCNLWHNLQLIEGIQYLVEVVQPLT